MAPTDRELRDAEKVALDGTHGAVLERLSQEVAQLKEDQKASLAAVAEQQSQMMDMLGRLLEATKTG